MSRIMLTGDGNLGSTAVSNVFIDHYMKEANDAQIKVYLYLLRNSGSDSSFEIGDIADTFNHTEKDVIRSLKYWEKEGLLRLRYDLTGEICGITLLGIRKEDIGEEKAVAAPAAPVLSIVPSIEEKKAPAHPPVPEKPSYSADDLRAFKAETRTEELIAVTESYLAKTISPSDLRSLLYIHKELSFDFEMLDLLLQYCVSKNKRSFNYIEAVAVSWFQQGIKTPAQAKDGIARYERTTFDIMAALGKSGTPTIKETEFISRWLGTYGFDREVVLAACERTVMKTESDRFPYAEGILSKWHEQGLRTLAEIETAEENYRKAKQANTARKTNSYPASYQKTTYDFAALQKFINEN